MAGKWIAELKPETPVADAARWVLAMRLEVVREQLRLALHGPAHIVEHVHQLRVGTRRVSAALRIFAECLPEKANRKARKTMRRIRRAAGAARDWDVFRLRLDEPGHRDVEASIPGIDFLLGYAVARRVEAQEGLAQASPDFPFRFERFLAETVGSVRAGGRDLRSLALPLLERLFRELESAGQGDHEDHEHLHQMRILGKQLRYAMEVFATCFAAPFRDELYPAVETMQEILGQINDGQVAGRHLSAIREEVRLIQPAAWKRLRPGIERLVRHDQRKLPGLRKEFRAWWRDWQEARAVDRLRSLLLDLPSSTQAPSSILYGTTNGGEGEVGSAGTIGGNGRGEPSPETGAADSGPSRDGARVTPGGGTGGGPPEPPDSGIGGNNGALGGGSWDAGIVPGGGDPGDRGAQTPP